jgi:flagellar P-ring protein precursor FlgI
MVMKKDTISLLTMLALLAATTAQTHAAQVQDFVRIKGAESNKLVGMGLVVGLNGTGDGKFLPAMRPLAAMMQRLIDPNVAAIELKDVKNVAVVSLTAHLPGSGVREGDTVDVQVASVGTAKSLSGGRLFMTPLLPPVANGQARVLAYAEGQLILEDEDTPTVAKIERGATLTADVYARYMDDFGRMTLVINEANATWPMANTIAALVNDLMSPDGPAIAYAVDQKNIIVQIPPREQTNPAGFISQVLEIPIDPTLVRTEARVTINQRTGTIVMTADVQISPVVISHKGLTITTITPPIQPTAENPQVNQMRFVEMDPSRRGGTKLRDLAAAFEQLKVPTEDQIAIIKEIHRTGKLHARLILED